MQSTIKKKDDLHIVVADDELEDHELIKKAIKECDLNYIVTSVYNGMQLMNLLHKKGFYKTENPNNPDLVILDLKMPIMDGFEALKQIKNNEQFKHIPVYILSESSHSDHKRSTAELGAEKFYTKPFNYGELQGMVSEICNCIRESKNNRAN
jgi:CheY-like chemotaxis protein